MTADLSDMPFVAPEHEARLAHELLGQPGNLRARILYALLGKPLRYSDLRPLLAGKPDNSLTVALRTLQRDGLVERRTNARREPVIHTYELTPLGVQVVLAMESLRPLEEKLKLLGRALG